MRNCYFYHNQGRLGIEQLRGSVATAMRRLDIPGVSFALLDHGKLVYEGGVGVREQGKSTPVDAHTLFMAASNTTGMSTLLLATLADEGKLRWDQPVTQIYPSFRLGNENVTRQVLVKQIRRRQAQWQAHPDCPRRAA